MLTRLMNAAGIACVVTLLLLSLLPAKEMVRTGAPKGQEHFAAYFLTAVVLSIGLGRQRRFMVVIGLSALAAAMEILQRFSPGRTPHLSDFIASSTGAAVGVLFAVIMARAFVRSAAG